VVKKKETPSVEARNSFVAKYVGRHLIVENMNVLKYAMKEIVNHVKRIQSE
jgi:hypothetical protein